jgi:linoleoyl-CoA desaturase
MRSVRYKEKGKSPFMQELESRIDSYFRSRNLSTKANSLMVFKSVFFLCIVALSYALIMVDQFGPWTLLLLAIIFGLSTLCVHFNIAHDAAHNAYSKRPIINKLLHGTFYIIGANPYIWKMKHNLNHHHNTNVPGIDWTIGNHGKSINYSVITEANNPYQYLYAPMLYPLYTLFLVFYKDFQMLFSRSIGNVKIVHPVSEYYILIISKLAYFAYTLAIPIAVLSIPWWQVVIGFIVMHLFAGVLLTIAAILPHLGHQTVFPLQYESGEIDYDWARHHIETTTDYATSSWIANWFLGGLSTHTIHHLFPGICHIHYIPLTRILKETAKEYGIRYSETTLWGSIRSHFKLLKRLGTPGQADPDTVVV